MKYSINDFIDCLVDHGDFDYYFKFSPDMVIEVRRCQRRYLDQIQKILNLGVSPSLARQLRLLALEILIV